LHLLQVKAYAHMGDRSASYALLLLDHLRERVAEVDVEP
jgi:hypothetical protein